MAFGSLVLNIVLSDSLAGPGQVLDQLLSWIQGNELKLSSRTAIAFAIDLPEKRPFEKPAARDRSEFTSHWARSSSRAIGTPLRKIVSIES